MKLGLAFCLVWLAASVAVCQDLKETYGKTNAQILSMGYDKWYAFFTGKEGEHTQGMARSGYFYADALAWRNRGLLARQPSASRSRLIKTEKALKSFGSSVIEVQRALSGGGTLWQLTRSSDAVDVQETVYALLGGKSKAAKRMMVSMAKKELDALAKDLSSSPESTWQFEFTKSAAQKDLKMATASFNELVSLAKGLSRSNSDHVLGYCLRVMSNAQMGN